MSLNRDLRLIEATNPVLSMMNSLLSHQEQRMQVVSDIAASLRDPEPDLGEREQGNKITRGMA